MAPRRAATTSSTSRSTRSRPPRKASRRSRSCWASRTSTTSTADPRLARHFEQALRAHALYKVNRDYIVKDGEIVIVDEFTGRQMPGRRWSEGLHQAVEAKEGLRVQRESVTLATITFQNYFRLYDKLSGMTGTAMTEQEEFFKIYGLEVVAIPTHRPMIREDDADLVFRDGECQVQRAHRRDRRDAGRRSAGARGYRERREERGALRDARSGAASSTRSSTPSSTRRKRPSWPRPVALGAVTIATNMAGRGTDIMLGGDPAGPGVRGAPPAGPQPRRGGAGGLRGRARQGQGRDRRGARAGRRGGRSAHHRHRAPRRPAHRQPAPRPCWPPG